MGRYVVCAVAVVLLGACGGSDEEPGGSEREQAGSRAEAACVEGGIGAFDRGEVDAFWKREGRVDYRAYIVGTCRGADRRGLLDRSGSKPQIARIAGQVILRMVRSGQIRDPRTD
jgi:hypothetical protein